MYYAPIIIFLNDNLKTIKFSNGCTLRQIKPEELEKYFKVSIEFKSQRPEKIYRISENYHFLGKYGIWTDIPMPYGTGFLADAHYPYFILESESQNTITEILIGLRILKDSKFFCPISVDHKNSSYHFNLPFNFSWHFDYYLNKEEITLLKQIIKKIRNLNEVFKSRFLISADQNLSTEVSIVELVSIMETLVCGNEKNELRFRFALFASYIINKYKKITSFQEMKSIYDLRSDLVHTGKSNKLNNQSLIRINFLSRELIKYYLLENFSTSKINDWIFRDLGISEE